MRRLTYAARREAERTSGSEQERRAAGSPQPQSRLLPPPGGRGEPPATPPDSYPLHAYLKEREREKERYLSPSERDAEDPTILRSNGAAKRWQPQQPPKNSLSRESLPPPTSGLSARARPLPLPSASTTLGPWAAAVVL